MKNILNLIEPIWHNYQNSKNKIYFLLENKILVISLLGYLTLFFAIIGFMVDREGVIECMMNTIDVFILGTPNVTHHNILIVIARLLAVGMLSFVIFALFLDDLYNRFFVSSISDKPYDLIIGLGKHNRAYLDNLHGREDSLIILELDDTNLYIKHYRKKGFGIVVGDYQNDIVDLKQVKHIIVSTGSDNDCIDIASYFSMRVTESRVKIYTHIVNRNLNIFFKEQFLREGSVGVVPFSFESNAVKSLWKKHSVLGNYYHLTLTDETLHYVIVGSSSLAKELVYYLANLAHLPSQNRVVIHLVDSHSQAFKDELYRDFSSMDKIANISIEAHVLDKNSLDFYTDPLWQSENLVHVMIADEYQEQNIDTALRLYDITYRDEMVSGTMQTDILLYIQESNILTDRFYEKYQNLYTFGAFDEVASKDVIIDEKLDCMAKYIHSQHDMKVAWEQLDLHKKESNIFQALHIDVKLLSLGLTKKSSAIEQKSQLLQTNSIIFDKQLLEIDIDAQAIEEQLEAFKSDYFPKAFDTLFTQITRAEHNRWMAYHFLNGWSHNEKRDNEKKHHHYLVPIEDFGRDEGMMMSYRYDLKALFMIPKYLAECGFEIVEV